VAEEGMAKSAPAVEGGVESAIAGVEEVVVSEAAEAAEGEMIDTMAGTNFFAFSKKAFSSERVQPWGEPTFSQSKSTPCAQESAIAPSAPRFKESPFSWRTGSSVVSKASASFFTSLFGTSAFCLGYNRTNIRVRTRLTSSKISWINIQFASSKLTAVIRGSSPDCRVDKDTLVNPVKQRGQKNKTKRKKGKY
jgi:hypothetical protein